VKNFALVLITFLVNCSTPLLIAQALPTAEKPLTIEAGVDLGVLPGGFYTGYNYDGTGGIEYSNSTYQSGTSFGGSVQITHHHGWVSEVRYRRSSLNTSTLFLIETGGQIENLGFCSTSNSVAECTAHFSAIDFIQSLPVLQKRALARHGLFFSAVAGVSTVHASTREIVDITSTPMSHGDSTITHALWGPKAGGRLTYKAKRIELSTEATLGYLHEDGGYRFDSYDILANGQTVQYDPFVLTGTTWSWEKNWRNTLSLRATSHLAISLTHEMRIIDNPNPNYLFVYASSNGVTSQFTGSRVLMIGVKYRL
jgi:hypothetical protein